MLLLGAVIATVLNIVILLTKFKRKRYQDALLDMSLLALVFWVLKGSELMLLTGIFSSLCVSIYLWFWPPSIRSIL